MAEFRYIDADSHIEEGPDVWAHIESAYKDRAPQLVNVAYSGPHQYRDMAWLIDGRIRPHNQGRGPTNHSSPAVMTWAKMKPISVESQMMSPPSARLADMDRFGMIAQVNYPTVFLEHLSDDQNLEAALMRSWNRAIHEKSSHAPDRMKWVALIPFWDPDAARKEIAWAKKAGAVGVYTLGTVYDTFLNDRRFDPIYAACEEHDIPVCVHIGWSHRGLNQSCDSMYAAVLFTFEHSVLYAFYAFVGGGILDRFRKLRVAFMEGPLNAYASFLGRMNHWRKIATTQTPLAIRPPAEYLAEGRVFFSFEGDEFDLSATLDVLGIDNVMLTADFPHVHFDGAELCTGMSYLAADTRLTEEQRRKLSLENAQRFYGFTLPKASSNATNTAESLTSVK